MKFKYFTIGALASFPITWWLNKKATLKQIQFLFKAVLISSSLASISGMIGWLTGFNPLKWAPPTINYQNAGMFSISLTYSHNEAVFCILLIGILLNYNEFKEYVSKKLLIACFIINLIGFYTSYSRGAFIAFLVVLPFFFFKKNLKKFVIAIITSSIFFYLAYYYFPHFKTVFSGRQHSSGLRYGLWMAALKLFELNPIMGVGFRNFQPWSTFIKSQYGYFEPLWEGHAHNNYLEILAGMGLVGIIPFIIWIFGWLIDSFKRDDLLGKIFFPTILMIILGGLTQNTITDGVNLFFFMALYSFYNSKYKPNI
jgi:O-antigen ligase